MSFSPGTLYYGDCLDWMSQWDDQCVDLIYADPPFNSKQDYSILFSDKQGELAQYRAFTDTWTWDSAAEDRLGRILGAVGRSTHQVIGGLHRILGESGALAYLTYMAERLEHIHRLLKPTGSLYLHCDPTMSHYLKVVLDAIFGPENFCNEIVWRRTGSHNKLSRQYGPIHDTILFYFKSPNSFWRQTKRPYMKGHVDKFFVKDEKGYRTKYYGNVLTGSGKRGGESGKPWLGINPSDKGWHWAIPGALIEDAGIDVSGLGQHQKLDLLFELGYIKHSPGQAWPIYERHIKPDDGQSISDIWAYQPYTGGKVFRTKSGVDKDVRWISPNDKERLGYPTQKPLGLLRRIIQASSNPDDVVLDPFCGCGTAVEAAYLLSRQWIGIDISSFAIDLIREKRFKYQPVATQGIPYDHRSARKLAREKPFDFESWAVTRLPGFAPNTKQRADGGVDGRAKLYKKPDNWKSRLALAQVKGGKFKLGELRDFIHVTNRDKAALGVYVTLDPVTSTQARKEAVKAHTITVGADRYPRCQLWPIANHFDGKRPHLPTMYDPYTGKPLSQYGLFPNA